MDVKKMKFEEFKEVGEGLIFLGAGGEINDWIQGISERLKEDKISTSDVPEELFDEIISLQTTGGRIDLAFIPKKGQLDYGKLAIWRIHWGFTGGHCSWISDYKVNYANQH